MSLQNININSFHSSKWKITISNIPTITKVRDLASYELFVKNFTFPGLNNDLMNVNFKGSQTHHSISKDNTDLPTFDISFKVNEDLTNFYNLHEYMLQMRFGQNITKKFLHENIVKTINLQCLDNQRRVTKTFKFSNCYITNLSSLQLDMGIDNELTFSTTWKYEEINVL